jgi:acyl carrier protein
VSRERRKDDLLRFLRSIQRPDRSIDEIDEHQSLLESGWADSLAILELVTYLEETHGIDFRERGVDPAELESVALILDLIERETSDASPDSS